MKAYALNKSKNLSWNNISKSYDNFFKKIIMIEKITYKDFTYAIVVRSEYRSDNIDFINDPSDILQVGYMSHKKNHKIVPHRHKDLKKEYQWHPRSSFNSRR